MAVILNPVLVHGQIVANPVDIPDPISIYLEVKLMHPVVGEVVNEVQRISYSEKI